MADALIMDEIICVLSDKGTIEVPTHGAFRHQAGIHGSSTEVKRALGSLIKAGQVRRHRPAPVGCTADEQPITFSLMHCR